MQWNDCFVGRWKSAFDGKPHSTYVLEGAIDSTSNKWTWSCHQPVQHPFKAHRQPEIQQERCELPNQHRSASSGDACPRRRRRRGPSLARSACSVWTSCLRQEWATTHPSTQCPTYPLEWHRPHVVRPIPEGTDRRRDPRPGHGNCAPSNGCCPRRR